MAADIELPELDPNTDVLFVDAVNEQRAAMKTDWVPRNAEGVPEDLAGDLGTELFRWRNGYIQNLFLGDGIPVDTTLLQGQFNRIVQCTSRDTSIQPNFISAVGAALAFDVLAAENPAVPNYTRRNLEVVINDTAVSVTADINKASLLPAPSTNNTALVNEPTLSNQPYSFFFGENGGEINIDNADSEVTNRIGQIVAFRKGVGEILIGYLESATKLINVRRGYFFNASGIPIYRGGLSNDDTLTLLIMGWVFLDVNGINVDVSYVTPIYLATQPANVTDGQYWFDMANNRWMRANGATYDDINRILIGEIVNDTGACIAARSVDLTGNYQEINTFVGKESKRLKIKDIHTLQLETGSEEEVISVYGTEFTYRNKNIEWDIEIDFEAITAESSDTLYYAYITQDGDPIISSKRPYVRNDLRGNYHPHQSWRAIHQVYNNSSGDFEFNQDATITGGLRKELITADGKWIAPINTKEIKISVVGGGGGNSGFGAPGANGGATSFGSAITATGGLASAVVSGPIVIPGPPGTCTGGTINRDGSQSDATTGDRIYHAPIDLAGEQTIGDTAITGAYGSGHGFGGGGGSGVLYNYNLIEGVYQATVGGGGVDGIGSDGGADGIILLEY